MSEFFKLIGQKPKFESIARMLEWVKIGGPSSHGKTSTGCRQAVGTRAESWWVLSRVLFWEG